jgi:hypothetical protein
MRVEGLVMVKGLIKSLLVVVGSMVVGSSEANAQMIQRPPQTISLAGPRLGATVLSDSVRSKLQEDMGIDVGPVISQFGWQKEKRFLSSPTGFTGVTEFVFLAGGLDQGVLLPSFNWLIGARTAQGVEFAAGPNLTPAGLAIAIAGGVTFQTGNLNIPVNLAVVPSRSGTRVSMLIGFNGRRP